MHSVFVRFKSEGQVAGDPEPGLELSTHPHDGGRVFGVTKPNADFVPAIPTTNDGAIHDVAMLLKRTA